MTNSHWNDGYHVVFGKVVSGEEIVDAIAKCGTSGDGSGTPHTKVTIVDSGDLGAVTLEF